MYVRIVTFRLAGLAADAYHAHALEIADDFNSWPGLRSKLWLADHDTNTYGGVYVFESPSAAESSRDAELFKRMQSSPYFADLRIAEFDVFDAPTAVTGGSLAPPAVATRGV